MKNPWFFIVAFITIVSSSLAQMDVSGNNNRSFLKGMYIKGGIDISSFSNTKLQLHSLSNTDFWGSLAYDFRKQLQLEFMYKYLGELSSNYVNIAYQNMLGSYYYSKGDSYYSHNFYFKANYFIEKDRNVNPIYLTGSIIFAIQRVTNSESSMSNTFDTTHHWYTSNNYFSVLSSYNRVLFGSAIGVGLYFDFGRVGFQSEFSFSARVAPFVNRGFKEYTFDLSLAPVFKFVK
jgi:hypothetical protein